MPALRLILLWHQHQPFYKDLVTGEYRLPWVRLHALKDYYGMVKLLDEFPNVHQNFNLVPSLIVQIQDYVAGTAQDPFLKVAAQPAKDLTLEQRKFALQYLFQANPANLIGRYPRYGELWERFREHGQSAEKAEKYFQPRDFTDLQVLSPIAWFDALFLEATDEGLLGRSTGVFFQRDGNGRLPAHLAERLYNIHHYENGQAEMHMVFRDHTISDMIGFVYSGRDPGDAAGHLLRNIKEAAQPVLAQGRDAVMSVILDGENAWEYYPKSGREFLRRFYDGLQREGGVEVVTVSEAISRHRNVSPLKSLVPGSWIYANFNVWIGAPEDNRAWD